MKLKTKIIALALSPLIIATTTQLIMEGKSRTSATERQIERQHDRLLASGQQGVINMIDAANRVFQQYLGTPGVSDDKAMELALDAIRGMKYEDDNYVFVFDYSGLMLVSANESGENVPMWGTKDRHGNLMIQEMIDIAKTKGAGTYAYHWDNPATGNIEPKYSYIENIPGTELIIGTGIYLNSLDEAMEEFSAIAKSDLYRDMRTNILISLLILVSLGLLSARFANRVMKPIEDTADAMREIAEGKGDLTKRIDVKNRDEIGELATQFNNFAERMRTSLVEVRKNAYEVNGMSSEVATGSEELAARIEQSASNIQQTTASMEEITSTVGHTADSASEASKLAEHSSKIAQEGADAMVEVETTMSSIKSSGEKINDIISMMDDIAFQTNILALNASVEAARAGEQGRGFSVVAQEVRNLAQRSAEASKDIRGLIEGSVRNTEQGSKIVSLAGEKMKEIVSSIEKVSQAVSEISTGTREQQAGIEQVNTAVTEMDSVTQENSTLIQQSAGAAHGMRDTAQKLSKLVGSFILGDDEEVSGKPSSLRKNHTAERSSVSHVRANESPASKRGAENSKTSTPPLDDDWSEF